MKITPVSQELACSIPKSLIRFFDISTNEGFKNAITLKVGMMKKYRIADLGVVESNNFSTLCDKIKEFKDKGLATLTIRDDAYKHSPSSKMNTHTIGLAINKGTNQHFYQSKPEILILDSMGDNYPGAKNIHQALIRDFIEKMFPASRVTITHNPQQTSGSLTCLNWALANLKAVSENFGRANILTLLPKSDDLPRILEEQMHFAQQNPCEF